MHAPPASILEVEYLLVSSSFMIMSVCSVGESSTGLPSIVYPIHHSSQSSIASGSRANRQRQSYALTTMSKVMISKIVVKESKKHKDRHHSIVANCGKLVGTQGCQVRIIVSVISICCVEGRVFRFSKSD